jgi:hypothetical protein
MAGRPPPPTRHNLAPAPSTLPEELLACFLLVRRDGAEPQLSPFYDEPDRVLERSTYFFLLEMGKRTEKVSTLCLKAARTQADTEPAKPARRGRPVEVPPVCASPPSQRGRSRQVTFSLPPTSPPTTPSTSASDSQRPATHPTQPLSLPPQGLGGTCGGVPSVPARFPASTVT